ncbi:hypothetical protein V6N13_033901 [Hibiscus sabdariffa]
MEGSRGKAIEAVILDGIPASIHRPGSPIPIDLQPKSKKGCVEDESMVNFMVSAVMLNNMETEAMNIMVNAGNGEKQRLSGENEKMVNALYFKENLVGVNGKSNGAQAITELDFKESCGVTEVSTVIGRDIGEQRDLKELYGPCMQVNAPPFVGTRGTSDVAREGSKRVMGGVENKGVLNPGFNRSFKLLMMKYKPIIVVHMEPRISGMERRCSLLLASEVRVIEDIITMGNKMVEECSRTAFIGKESRHRRISSTQWSRPSTSWIRLNVDTMESTFDNKAGVGMSFEITKGDGYLDFLD